VQAGWPRLTFDEALALLNGWIGNSGGGGSSERRRSPCRDRGHRSPRTVTAWNPAPGRDEEDHVDVAELSERLFLFACAKNEDPDVNLNEVVTMPGHAGAMHASENDLDSPGRRHPGWLALRRPWRERPENRGRCDRRATIDVPSARCCGAIDPRTSATVVNPGGAGVTDPFGGNRVGQDTGCRFPILNVPVGYFASGELPRRGVCGGRHGAHRDGLGRVAFVPARPHRAEPRRGGAQLDRDVVLRWRRWPAGLLGAMVAVT
jgi:hypothetical protein